MTGVTELGYVRFGVSNLDEWRSFAAGIVGLEAIDDGERLYLRTDYHHHRITLEADGSDDLLSAGLRVAGAGEFEAMKQTLRDADIAFEEGSRALAGERHVLALITLEDPAGNPLEIFHGPRVDAHLPFHAGRRMHGSFVTGDGGVGHMILRHAGVHVMHDFYQTLGMRGGVEYQIDTPDGTPFELLFMHCNSRDHTVAFGPPCDKHINHLMLEVDNLDDVFLTYDYVQRSNYPIAIEPGKHANDEMFSFYFATPSEWLLEIGYGGRPATHQSEYYTRDTYGHEGLL